MRNLDLILLFAAAIAGLGAPVALTGTAAPVAEAVRLLIAGAVLIGCAAAVRRSA